MLGEMKIMRKNFIFISIIIFLLSACSNREAKLIKCIEKENKLSRLIQDETKKIMDEKHPELKDINEAYYNRMITHDQLVLKSLTYVLTKHPERIEGLFFSVPMYDLTEKEEKKMLENPMIKKHLPLMN